MCIYIRAMSEYQSEIYRSISSKAAEIDEHILSLLMFPHASEVNHWKQEIYAFLHEVKRTKNKKFPKPSFILKALQVSNDMLVNLSWAVIDDKSDLTPMQVSEDAMLSAVSAYQEWLASTLSQQGIARRSDVYNKLSEVTGCD